MKKIPKFFKNKRKKFKKDSGKKKINLLKKKNTNNQFRSKIIIKNKMKKIIVFLNF